MYMHSGFRWDLIDPDSKAENISDIVVFFNIILPGIYVGLANGTFVLSAQRISNETGWTHLVTDSLIRRDGSVSRVTNRVS